MSACLQVIAQFTQSIEVTPSKAQREGIDAGTGSLDSSTRSFPRIPDDCSERDDSVGRTTTTTRYSATTTTGRGGREQRSGGEHMFHQQVSVCVWMLMRRL